MTSPTLIFLALFLAALILGTYALLCLRRDGWRSVLGPCLVLAVSAGSLLVAYLCLGRPLPYSWIATPLDYPIDVVGYDYREGEAIYLFLRVPGEVEPLTVSLPWDLETAVELRDAVAAAGEAGEEAKFRPRMSDGADTQEPMFWADPQVALPDKPEE